MRYEWEKNKGIEGNVKGKLGGQLKRNTEITPKRKKVTRLAKDKHLALSCVPTESLLARWATYYIVVGNQGDMKVK